MRIATWNINSVRIRLDPIARLTEARRPDVLCLQEIKVEDHGFPAEALRALGYVHQVVSGMKAYHGVAILSRLPLANAGTLHWCEQTDCRHVFAELTDGTVIHNFYVPAGGDIPDPDLNPKFAHKLRFMDELAAWMAGAHAPDARRVLVGDLNVAPLETDVWSHRQLLKVVSHTPVEVERFARMQAAGEWVDAVRRFIPPDEKLYTWWSYRARDWSASDRGRRLDHVWVTPALADALRGAEVIRAARGWPQASDHVPVLCDLDLPAIDLPAIDLAAGDIPAGDGTLVA
ncbi:MAG: exodeoxyribonuclease III [Alphaproteobacteria bacterium]